MADRIYTRQFIFPIKTDKGFGLGSIAQDITSEKLVEDAIRESEEKYRLLANVTNDVIYTVDLQGTVTYISPRISRYGYTTEEIISRNFSGFIAEEDMPAVVTEFEKTIVTGMPSVIQLRLRDKAGNLHWMEDNGAPVVNASGSVVAITGILRDITERKKAEESVRKSFAILKGVVESPKDVVIFALDRAVPVHGLQ